MAKSFTRSVSGYAFLENERSEEIYAKAEVQHSFKEMSR